MSQPAATTPSNNATTTPPPTTTVAHTELVAAAATTQPSPAYYSSLNESDQADQGTATSQTDGTPTGFGLPLRELLQVPEAEGGIPNFLKSPPEALKKEERKPIGNRRPDNSTIYSEKEPTPSNMSGLSSASSDPYDFQVFAGLKRSEEAKALAPDQAPNHEALANENHPRRTAQLPLQSPVAMTSNSEGNNRNRVFSESDSDFSFERNLTPQRPLSARRTASPESPDSQDSMDRQSPGVIFKANSYNGQKCESITITPSCFREIFSVEKINGEIRIYGIIHHPKIVKIQFDNNVDVFTSYDPNDTRDGEDEDEVREPQEEVHRVAEEEEAREAEENVREAEEDHQTPTALPTVDQDVSPSPVPPGSPATTAQPAPPAQRRKRVAAEISTSPSPITPPPSKRRATKERNSGAGVVYLVPPIAPMPTRSGRAAAAVASAAIFQYYAEFGPKSRSSKIAPRTVNKRKNDDIRETPMEKLSKDGAAFNCNSIADVRQRLEAIKHALDVRDYGFAALDLHGKYQKLVQSAHKYDLAPTPAKLDRIIKQVVALSATCGLSAH